MDKGVDGFRVDAIPHLFEDQRFLDEPLSGGTSNPNDYGYLNHIYTKDLHETYEMTKEWGNVLAEYSQTHGESRVMMTEAYTDIELTMKYYDYGADFPFNFWLLDGLDTNTKAVDVKNKVDGWMSNMPEGATANWVVSN